MGEAVQRTFPKKSEGRRATGRPVVKRMRTGSEVDQTTAHTAGGRLARYGKASERAAGTNKPTNRSQHNSKQVFETFAIYGRPRGCTSEPPRGGCLVMIANCHRWRKAIAARPRSNREAIKSSMEGYKAGALSVDRTASPTIQGPPLPPLNALPPSGTLLSSSRVTLLLLPATHTPPSL